MRRLRRRAEQELRYKRAQNPSSPNRKPTRIEE